MARDWNKEKSATEMARDYGVSQNIEIVRTSLKKELGANQALFDEITRLIHLQREM
jgi:hypothetical protein